MKNKDIPITEKHKPVGRRKSYGLTKENAQRISENTRAAYLKNYPAQTEK